MIADSLRREVAMFELRQRGQLGTWIGDHYFPAPYRVQWTGRPTNAEIAFAERSGLLDRSDVA